ncbi:SGNH/GDSL hydrolase family protein [Micromonospora sp. NPDC000089]|uniref:SGNH/GDSL hydrolase family protein n=1 Tax=unclassified Micromonospora TaxID=2617518 RepID=UPI0036781707
MRRLRRTVPFGLVALLGCSPWETGPAQRPVSTPPPPAVVVALGDSVPAGTACACDPFPALYARRLSPAAASVDLARSGSTAADLLDQLRDGYPREVLRTATVVLIMAGANDFAARFPGGRDDDYRRIAGQVRADVATAVRQVRADAGRPVPVVVLGYWNVLEDGQVAGADYDADGTAEAARATSYANDALADAARDAAARFVPTFGVFKGADGTVDPTALLAADGDHPNARGHAAIATAIPAAVE